jgi:hypothetical protein
MILFLLYFYFLSFLEYAFFKKKKKSSMLSKKKKGKKDGEVFCETSKVQTSNDNGKKEKKYR